VTEAPRTAAPRASRLRTYLITHRHEPQDCAIAFAAWRGHDSPLRRETTLSSCLEGGHSIWWQIEARSEAEALELLPDWVAERSEISCVREIAIP